MKKKIIVVDDEPLIAVLMKEIIEEDQGFEIAQIVTGKADFLNSVSQNSFDAAIVDVSMGNREGGIELLQMMKNKAIDLPFIMLSAHDELHYALKCLKAGAKGYINKKYICTDVTKCLKEVLGGHLYISGDKGEEILEKFKELNTSAKIEPR
jgi:DNA-binding NarL/FixJ family response regulator